MLGAATPLTVTSPAALTKIGPLAANAVPITFTAGAVIGFPPTSESTYIVTATSNFNFPRWCNYLDIIIVGGGRGGQGAGWVANGVGGTAGSWAGITLQRGVDIGWAETYLAITIGAGGSAGSGGAFPTAGGNGGTTTVAKGSGGTIATGSGGTGTVIATRDGPGPGNYTFNGVTYVGGSGDGNAPGSGGRGGAASSGNGTTGGRGQAWIRAYQ